MSLLDCVLNPDTGCIDCPAIPFIPATPPHLDVTPNPGWNASANSVSMLDGDVHTVFQINSSLGAVACGFKSVRNRLTIPETINYAFYFQSVAGLLFASVVELGHTRVADVEVDPSATFEIRRLAGQVLFLIDGIVVYRSTVRSSGALVVNACMYLAGDSIA